MHFTVSASLFYCFSLDFKSATYNVFVFPSLPLFTFTLGHFTASGLAPRHGNGVSDTDITS